MRMRLLFVIPFFLVWYVVISNLSYILPTSYQTLPSESLTIAQNLWDYPQPTTDAIKGIELRWRVDTGSVTNICVEVSQFRIWEPGEFGEDTYKTVMRSSSFKLNHVSINRVDTEFGYLTTSIARFENGLSGKLLGSHGGSMSGCFKTDNIPDGLNLAELRFQSTSGKVYEYQWAFKLWREDQIIHVELPDSIWLYKNAGS